MRPDPVQRDTVLAAVSSRCRGLLLRASHRTGHAGLASGSLDRYFRVAKASCSESFAGVQFVPSGLERGEPTVNQDGG